MFAANDCILLRWYSPKDLQLVRDMNFVKGFIKQQQTPISALALPVSAAAKCPPYRLSVARWHGDSRAAESVIAVHDLLSNSSSWSPFVRALGKIPTESAENPDEFLNLAQPLNIYAIDLPHHQDSECALDVTAAASASSFLLQCAARVAEFEAAVLEPATTRVHLLGTGLGAQVCALVALGLQDKISSLTMVLPDGQLDATRSAPFIPEKLELLREAVARHSRMSDIYHFLQQRVPNDAERAALMHCLVDRGSKVELRPLLREKTSMASLDLSWPQACVPPQCVFHKPSTLICETGAAPSEAVSKLFTKLNTVHVTKAAFCGAASSDHTLMWRVVDAMKLRTSTPTAAASESS